MITRIDARTPTVAEYLQGLNLHVKNAASNAAQVDALIDLSSFKLRLGQREEASAHVNEAFLVAQSVPKNHRFRANARVMYGGGLVSYFAGRYAESIGQLHNAIESSRRSDDEINRIRSLTILALAFGRLGGYLEGLAYANAALDSATSRQDSFAMAHAYVALGFLHSSRDGGQPAKIAFEAAEPLAESSGDPLLIVAVSVNRAGTAHTIAQHAADLLEKNTTGSAIGHEALRQQIAEARNLCEHALVVSENLGHATGITIATSNIAEVCFLEGNVDEAIKIANRAIILAQDLGNLDHQCNTHLVLGTFCLASNKLAEANAALAAALGFAKHSGVLSLELRAQEARVECLERQQFLAEAAAVREAIPSLRAAIQIAARANQDALANVAREPDILPVTQNVRDKI